MAGNSFARFIDPNQSEYFGAQNLGDGSNTVGNGDGSGWLDWSKVPGFEGYTFGADNVSGSAGPNLRSMLSDRGYRLYENPLSTGGSNSGVYERGVVDAQGNFVGGPQRIESPSDRGFWNAAMLAAAGVGTGVATGALGGGVAGEAAAGAAGGSAGAGAGAGVGAAAGGAGAAGGSMGGAAAGGLGGMGWDALAQLGGTAIQSYFANQAAGDQRAATDAAIAEQRRQFDLTRGDFQPYRDAGVDALGQLRQGMNQQPTAEEVMATPGYQFGLSQGQQGIDRRIAAMGGRVSGAAIKAAGRFATDYATTGYNAAYQRGQDRLNRLAAIAGVGQTATGASAQAGQGATNAISGLISGQGDATAGGRMAQGNLWGNAANQFGALYGRNNMQPRPQPAGGYGGQGGWSSDPTGDPYYMGERP